MSKTDVVEVGKEFERAWSFSVGTVFGFVMKTAIELDLFEIMAKLAAAHNGTSPFGDDAKKLSADEIVLHFPVHNSATPVMLDRILRFLAANSVLIRMVVVGEDGKDKSLYGLSPICKYYISDEDGVSLASTFSLIHDKVNIDSWYVLKDAVLEGGIAFNMAHGMHAFEYPAKDTRFNEVFNKAMYNIATMTLKMILDVYTGFEGITEIIDVGGGTGATLAKITSKYPHIKGINFDLPHVIENAPPLSGVEHVAGDMFTSIPKGNTIFMKSILHDWSDEQCLKLLKNCYTALPESGKVIILDSVLPEYSDNNSSIYNLNETHDMIMMAINPGAKERSLKEFEALAKESGFAAVKLICNVSIHVVLEFYKKM